MDSFFVGRPLPQPDSPKLRSMGTLNEAISFLPQFVMSALDNRTANKKSQVIITEHIEDLSKELPILVYVHYSKNGIVSEREISTLQNVRKVGFQVCLVINSEIDEYQLLSNSFSDAQILRKNIGWDLGAYRDAFSCLEKNFKIGDSPIFFMNNSVIWFPEMVEDYFRAALLQKSDILASTISHQYQEHIQTFLFGALNETGLEALRFWLKTIKNWRMKRTVVRLGELGTHGLFKQNISLISLPDSKFLIEHGLKKVQESFSGVKPVISYEVLERLEKNRIFLMAGLPLNPSHSYWLELIENGFPGIKKDFIKSNPTAIYDYELAISMLINFGFSYRELGDLINSNRSKSLIVKLRSALRW